MMDMMDTTKMKIKQSRSKTDCETYNILGNKATSINRDLKQDYYSNLILEHVSSSDKVWKAVSKSQCLKGSKHA